MGAAARGDDDLGWLSGCGGVEGAIAHTAEETLNRLSGDQLTVARELFLNLTELGEGAEDTRRIASREELLGGTDAATLDGVIETMVRARLITTSKGEVEVAHEALIRRWPTLKEWLADNRERLRFERQMARDATDWEEAGRDPGLLYRGSRLAQAREKLTERPTGQTSLVRRFIRTSLSEYQREIDEKEARERQKLAQERALAEAQRQRAEEAEKATVKQSRLTRIAVAVGSVALLLFFVAGFAGIVASNNAREAVEARSTAEAETSRALLAEEFAKEETKRADRERTIAESRALAAQALSVVEDDPNLGLLLAIRANRIATTIEARRSLARLLADKLWVEDDIRESVLVGQIFSESNLGDLGGSLDIDSEGKWIASNRNGFVVLWDIETKMLEIVHEYREPANGLAFNPTKPILLFGSDNSILLKNLAEDTPSPPTFVVDTRASVDAIEFSRDGSFFAYTDGVDVAVWDIQSLQQLSKPVDNDRQLQISGLSFDPASNHLYGLSPGWGEVY